MWKLIKKLPRAYSLEFSPDGKLLARTSGASVTLYDGGTLDQLAVFKDIPYAAKLAFSFDCQSLVVKSTCRKIALYDLHDNKLRTIFTTRGTTQAQDEGLAFSRDGKSIYNCVNRNDLTSQIHRIDIGSGATHTLNFPENIVFHSIQYVPEKKCYDIFGFARADPVNTYFLIEYSEDANKIQKTGLPLECISIQYHPNTNSYFALTYLDIVKLSSDAYRVLSRHPIASREDHFAGKLTISQRLSHDGKILALAFSNRVMILDTESLQVITEILHDYIDCVSFSPDDKVLLIGGWNNSFIYHLEP